MHGITTMKTLDIIFDPFRVTFTLARKSVHSERDQWDDITQTPVWSTVGKIRQIDVTVTASGRDVIQEFSDHSVKHSAVTNFLSEVFQECGPYPSSYPKRKLGSSSGVKTAEVSR